ncbi:SCO4225 family membrane protein [Streptomyces sp. NPDC088246]|uniref:SCO4225 family membrane protein n=1 Tax=Streptomyces sp. NPDC088246 TaxID=3365842 RepID=UPI0037FB9DDF
MTGSGRSFPRLPNHALVDAVARVFLAVCAVLFVWALVVRADDSSDESVAGVIPLLATAAASLVLFVLPYQNAMFVAAVVLGAMARSSAGAPAQRRGDGPGPAPQVPAARPPGRQAAAGTGASVCVRFCFCFCFCFCRDWAAGRARHGRERRAYAGIPSRLRAATAHRPRRRAP